MQFLAEYTKEFKYNLKLAYPVILSLLGHTFVQLVDNIMVGQLGSKELAAVSLGNSFFYIGMAIGIGFSTAITPLVAQSDGSNDKYNLKKILFHGIVTCSILGFLMFLLVSNSKFLMINVNQPEEVLVLAKPYLNWISISLIPLVMFQGFKQFSDGMSDTKPGMYATIFSNIINIILNYVLIFGIAFFPKLGVEGAAIGTLISRFSMLLFIFFYFKISNKYKLYLTQFFSLKFRFSILKKIYNIGLPSALQMLFEVGFFTSAILLSGMIGKNAQAANQIALNLSTISYMVAMGLSVAAMIRVGNYLGKLNFSQLRRIAYSIFILIFLLDIIFCIVFLTLNKILPWIYLDSDNLNNYSDTIEVVKIASRLLIISAIFQIADGIQAVVLGALKGLQDVNIPTAITFISYWLIGFPVSYYLGIIYNFQAEGIWIGLLVGLTLSAFLVLLRFEVKIKSLIKKSLQKDLNI